MFVKNLRDKSPQNKKNSVNIYSPPSCHKPVNIYFFFLLEFYILDKRLTFFFFSRLLLFELCIFLQFIFQNHFLAKLLPTSEYLLAKANFICIWSLVGVNFTLRNEMTILTYLKNVQKQDVHMHTSTSLRWWLCCPTKANAVTRPTLKVRGKSLNFDYIWIFSLIVEPKHA